MQHIESATAVLAAAVAGFVAAALLPWEHQVAGGLGADASVPRLAALLTAGAIALVMIPEGGHVDRYRTAVAVPLAAVWLVAGILLTAKAKGVDLAAALALIAAVLALLGGCLARGRGEILDPPDVSRDLVPDALGSDDW